MRFTLSTTSKNASLFLYLMPSRRHETAFVTACAERYSRELRASQFSKENLSNENLINENLKGIPSSLKGISKEFRAVSKEFRAVSKEFRAVSKEFRAVWEFRRAWNASWWQIVIIEKELIKYVQWGDHNEEYHRRSRCNLHLMRFLCNVLFEDAGLGCLRVTEV